MTSHHVLRPLACLVLVVLATACEKKPDGSAAGGKLKLADVKKTYEAEFEDPAKMKDPMDKKVAAFVTKTGKPESETDRKKTWHAVEGDNCFKVELDTKDGSLMNQSARKSECGL